MARLPSCVSGPPSEAEGSGGPAGAGAGRALLPLLGPWMLHCLFRVSVWAPSLPGSPLPSGSSGSGHET